MRSDAKVTELAPNSWRRGYSCSSPKCENKPVARVEIPRKLRHDPSDGRGSTEYTTRYLCESCIRKAK